MIKFNNKIILRSNITSIILSIFKEIMTKKINLGDLI